MAKKNNALNDESLGSVAGGKYGKITRGANKGKWGIFDENNNVTKTYLTKDEAKTQSMQRFGSSTEIKGF